METLFISVGATVKQHENTLQVKVGNKKRSFPIEHLSHIVLLAESKLNSRLLCLCGKYRVRLSIFDYYGYFKGVFEPPQRNPSGKVKLKQAELLLNQKRRMSIAREIVRGAIHNMLSNLKYYQYRGNEGMKKPISEMRKIMTLIAKQKTTEELMGMEGQAHQWYYSAWGKIHPDLNFGKRVRRPPNNKINCLVSFLNQMVYTYPLHFPG